MNYAEDRIDRRARYDSTNNSNGLIQDWYKALQQIQNDTPTTTSSWSSSSSSSSSSSCDDDKMKHTIMSKGHELLARTLRDVGWCQHATFHYAMAWILQPNNSQTVGDYAQMVDLAGYPELGVLALIHYRSFGNLLSMTQFLHNNVNNNNMESSNNNNNNDKKNYHITLDDLVHKIQQNNPPPHGQDCGCGFASCGNSILSTIPMIHMDDTIHAFQIYQRNNNNNNNNNSNNNNDIRMNRTIQMPCANTILSIMSKNERLQRQQNTCTHNMKQSDTLMDMKEISCTKDIPSVLQFWQSDSVTATAAATTNSTTLTATNGIPKQQQHQDEETSTDSNTSTTLLSYRTLEPVLQMLLLKLLYVTLPSLAVEGILHSTEQLETSSKELSTYYKSHHAYYVLIRAVTFGERIKPHRRYTVPHYHVPVWDLVWNKDQRVSVTTIQKQQQQQQLNSEEMYGPNNQISNSCASQMDQPSSRKGLSVSSLPENIDTTEIHDFHQGIHNFISKLTKDRSHSLAFPNNVPLSLLSTPGSTGCSPQSKLKPLYVMGDSHVLSLAWQTIVVPTSSSSSSPSSSCQHESSSSSSLRMAVPVVVTGIKAWHTRPGTRFFTHYNLHQSLQRLPATCRTVLFSAGEIDCREGIGGENFQGCTELCWDKLTNTVREYVNALFSISKQYNHLQILVLPVAPHAHRSDRNGKVRGRSMRRQAMQQWNQTLQQQISNHHHDNDGRDRNNNKVFYLNYASNLVPPQAQEYVLQPAFNADYTHMNSAFLPSLEKALKECGCDPTLL